MYKEALADLIILASYLHVLWLSVGVINSLIMRGLHVWCDALVRESRHWANVVDNVYHVYAKRFLLTFEFEIAVKNVAKKTFEC